MKRLISILFAVCMCFSVCVALSSCGHTHTYKTEWSNDATHHWHDCEGCIEFSDKAEHTWNGGEVTTQPTPDADGVKTYTCTVCEATKTEPVEYVVDTTVTEGEWATAFDLGNNWTVVTEALHSGYQQTVNITQKRDGNKFSNKQVLANATTGDTLSSSERFSEIADTVWYDYRYDNGTEKYDRHASSETVEANLALLIASILPEEIRDFADYTYDEDTNSYVATAITHSNGTVLNDVTLKFEDGKLVSFSYSINMDDVSVPYTMTFTYGDAAVDLPSVEEAVVYTVTEEEWRINFNLTKGQSGAVPTSSSTLTEITSYTIYAVGRNSDGRGGWLDGTCLLKVAPDAMSIEFYIEEVLRDDESGTYPSTDVFYNGLTTSIMMYFPFADQYDDFTFDADKNAYVAERLTSTLADEYDPSNTYDLYTKTAEVTFINGYLNTVTVELCEENFEDVYSVFVFTFSDINNTTVEN